jgi:transposase-like protein
MTKPIALPVTTSSNSEITSIEDIFNLFMTQGVDAILPVFRTLMNETMKLERSESLKASPYERSSEREGYANGYKPKSITTRLGKITLDIPQARGMSFYPQSLEKGMRTERALKLAIAEMYVQGVSTRKVAEITEQLCGTEISSTQVSNLAKLLDEELEQFRNRDLGQFKYVQFDAIYEKMRHTGSVKSLPILVAIGIDYLGKREVLGVSADLSEAEIHWRKFMLSLQKRGLSGVELITSDDHPGIKKAIQAIFPSVPWQRCQFHMAQNAQAYAPKKSMKREIGEAVRNIFNSPTVEDAKNFIEKVKDKYLKTAPEFVRWLDDNIEEGLVVYNYPKEHRIKIRTSNCLERVNKEIRRRTKVAGLFPNQSSCLRLVTAVLQEIHETWATEPAYIKIFE